MPTKNSRAGSWLVMISLALATAWPVALSGCGGVSQNSLAKVDRFDYRVADNCKLGGATCAETVDCCNGSCETGICADRAPAEAQSAGPGAGQAATSAAAPSSSTTSSSSPRASRQPSL
jgi:hypothetical protein